MKRDYREDVKPDKDNLEIEWERQPSLYMYYAEEEVIAQEEKDKAERNLAVTKAEMDAKVRSDPSRYKIEKVSESAILNVVLMSEEYRKAEERLIVAKKTARLLGHAVTAIGEQKKRALTKLSDLWIAGYYGTGGIPKEMRENINKRIDDKVRSKLKDNPKLKRRRENAV
jgi:hypothetical protein